MSSRSRKNPAASLSVAGLALAACVWSAPAPAAWNAAAIEYRQTITRIVEPEAFDDWKPAGRHLTIRDITTSADGARVAFSVGAYTGGDPTHLHLYVVNADGSGLTDLTPHLHGDVDGTSWSDLHLTDDGSRLFFMAVDKTHANGLSCFYFDLNTLTCHVVARELTGTGYKKRFVVNGNGTRIFFRYEGGRNIGEKGIYFADIGTPPAKYMGLNEITAINDVYRIDLLDGSSDGTALLFRYGGWGSGGGSNSEPRSMWRTTAAGPARMPDEEHRYVWELQDVPSRLISADARVALYHVEDSAGGSDTTALYLVDLASGAKTLILAGGGDNITPTSLNPEGTHALVHGGDHNMALVDLDSGAHRDTYFSGITLDDWPPKVSDLCTGATHYFVGGRALPNVVYTEAVIDRVDVADPNYSQAPRIVSVEFSAAALLYADDPPEITVRVVVSDPQGAGNIDWVDQTDVVIDGLAHPDGLGKAPIRYLTKLKDDGTKGDEQAGDGVFTYNRVKVETSSEFFTRYALPKQVALRIVAMDIDGNYSVADARLLITDDPSAVSSDDDAGDDGDAGEDTGDTDTGDSTDEDAPPPDEPGGGDAPGGHADQPDEPSGNDDGGSNASDAGEDDQSDADVPADVDALVPTGCGAGACGVGSLSAAPLTILGLCGAKLRRKHRARKRR